MHRGTHNVPSGRVSGQPSPITSPPRTAIIWNPSRKNGNDQGLCGVDMSLLGSRHGTWHAKTLTKERISAGQADHSASGAAWTPLLITCPRRGPRPAAFTAKTSKIGLEITAATRAVGLAARPPRWPAGGRTNWGSAGGATWDGAGVNTPARDPGLRGVGDGVCCRCVRQWPWRFPPGVPSGPGWCRARPSVLPPGCGGRRRWSRWSARTRPGHPRPRWSRSLCRRWTTSQCLASSWPLGCACGAPRWLGPRSPLALASLSRNARGWEPCGWLTARQLELPRLGQRVRLERTPRPGARARPDPGSGHASWSAVQGSSGAGQWPQAQRDRRGDAARFSAAGLPARPVWRPACPGPRWIRLALPAGRPPGGRSEGAGHRPPTRHAGIGRGGTGAAVTHPRACSPQIDYELRASHIQPAAWPESGNPAPGNPGHISLGNGEKLKRLRRVWASPAAILDDPAPGGVRAAPGSA